MSTLIAYVRRLADRARGMPFAVDAVIAAACFVYVVIQAFVDECLYWWVPLLTAANTLPLLWRRRYPFAVTWIVGIATITMSLAEVIGRIPAAQLVVTYTFAALCPPGKRLIAGVATVLGVVVSIIGPKDEVLGLGTAGMTFAFAYAMGVGARARQDRIAMLEERARRLSEEQQAVAVRERERIAREMHDIIAHSMSMVAIQAEAGPVVVRSDPDKAEAMFDTISATAREALTQLRKALGVLRSDGAERAPQPGLEALPALVDRARNAGLAVTLEEDGVARPVPKDLATTAYRIVQESLTNTVKHAAAGAVAVRVRWRADALHLEVSDDGCGTDGKGEPGGHGLVGMRERVAAAHGELTYGPSADGSGFRVEARLPLDL